MQMHLCATSSRLADTDRLTMVDLHDDSINLRALKKIDNQITEIQFSAGQVAIYYFNIDDADGAEGNDAGPGGDGKWKRKEIEGALFFVRRATQPEYAFVVINKLSTINLVQKITKDLETNVQPPYLMYKNTENEIYCVWFYVRENCLTLNQKIVETIENMKKENLLSHSMNHFNGLNSSSSNSAQANSDLLKMILSVDSNYAPEAEGQKKKKAPQQQPQPVAATATAPVELVKPIAQRRSVNLKDLFESQLNISAASAPSAPAAETGLATATTPSISTLTPLKSASEKPIVQVPNKQEPVTPHLIKDENNATKNNFASPIRGTQANHVVSNAELSDSMIKSPFESLLQPQKLAHAAGLMQAAGVVLNNSHSKPPPPPVVSAESAETPLYLTMEQLKKTLVYLLQNDADFLHSIHTAYVSAIKK